MAFAMSLRFLDVLTPELTTTMLQTPLRMAAVVYGCTDPSASNFDPLATIDDGSCGPCGERMIVHLMQMVMVRSALLTYLIS